MLGAAPPSRPRNIRALVFASSFRLGGSERQAVELVKQLDRRGFELVVACFSKDGPLFDEIPKGLCGLEAFPLTGFVKPFTVLQAWRFFKFLRRTKVQVVQCFDYYSNVFAIPIAWLAGVPVVIGSRRDTAAVRTVAQRSLERLSLRLATGVVANAEAISLQLVREDGIRKDRVWTIYNGLDVSRFKSEETAAATVSEADRESVHIAVIANLRPEKGHLVFLEAAKRVCARYPGARLTIAGDGPMREAIASRATELDLWDRLELTGTIEDVPAFLSSVDIVVLPSTINEGLSNAVMEAMAASRPVVATDVGATREILIDGETGYLVQPEDATALAARIGDLCEDAEKRRSMGATAQRTISAGFTAERMGDAYARLYNDLLRMSRLH